jgi:hypothetical protein
MPKSGRGGRRGDGIDFIAPRVPARVLVQKMFSKLTTERDSQLGRYRMVTHGAGRDDQFEAQRL